jgi:GNAT superfamily N-acetyltransferase
MRAIRVEEADAFLALVGPFLRAREAEHNLALGLLGRLRTEPRLYGFDPTFVVVENAAGEVSGCLLRTPPHGIVLSRFEDLAGVDAVAAEVIDMHPGLPGAVGPVAETARFAEAWSRSTRAPARIAVRQRVHAAGGVQSVPRAPGHMRSTHPDDVPTVVAWLQAFAEEALGEAPNVEDVELTYRRKEADPDGAWLVWDDGGPVSLAGYGNPTPSGTRVGPVYTPPEHRGRGYATSLVAELTAERLAAGLAFCFLFTNLANPTSNAIYARIGYEPVADWDQWSLLPLE